MRLGNQAPEAEQVDLVEVDLDQVAGADRTHLGVRDPGQGTAQVVDVHLEVLDRGPRRGPTPQRRDEPGDRHHPPRLQQQRGEHAALLWRTQVHPPAAGPRLDRTEQPETHQIRVRTSVSRQQRSHWQAAPG
jgi:hypothetical protein